MWSFDGCGGQQKAIKDWKKNMVYNNHLEKHNCFYFSYTFKYGISEWQKRSCRYLPIELETTQRKYVCDNQQP